MLQTKMFKLIVNISTVILLFSLILVGTISCNKKNKSAFKESGYDLNIDKIVIKDTIFVIDTLKEVCPPISLEAINDSLMLLYIKKRNDNVINKIKNNKGIIFTEKELEKFKNLK